MQNVNLIISEPPFALRLHLDLWKTLVFGMFLVLLVFKKQLDKQKPTNWEQLGAPVRQKWVAINQNLKIQTLHTFVLWNAYDFFHYIIERCKKYDVNKNWSVWNTRSHTLYIRSMFLVSLLFVLLCRIWWVMCELCTVFNTVLSQWLKLLSTSTESSFYEYTCSWVVESFLLFIMYCYFSAFICCFVRSWRTIFNFKNVNCT